MLPSGFVKDEDSNQEQEGSPIIFPEQHLEPAPTSAGLPQHLMDSSHYFGNYGPEPYYYSYMMHPSQQVTFSSSRGTGEYDNTLVHSPGPASTARLTHEHMSTLMNHPNQHHQQQQQQQQQQVWTPAIPPSTRLAPGYEQREQDLFGRLVSMARSTASNDHADMWHPQPSPTWLSNLDLNMGEGSSNNVLAELPRPRIVPSQDTRQYELRVVQQPSRARSCGFSDKDRRPVSPAPIVLLIVKGLDGTIVPPQYLVPTRAMRLS